MGTDTLAPKGLIDGTFKRAYSPQGAGAVSFTPGPWTPHFADAITITAPDGSRIAILGHLTADGRRDTTEVERSARLIAAAPDMLAVLLKLRKGDLHQRVRPLFDEAQAAIAKATGVKA